jgi:hypothetical protein
MHAVFTLAGQATAHLEDKGQMVHALAVLCIREATEGACAIVQQHRDQQAVCIE